jgi:transposase
MIELVRAGRTREELAKEFEPSAQANPQLGRAGRRDEGQREDDLATAEREELNRLRRENRQLKLEREILSKVAAWFARETDVAACAAPRTAPRRGTHPRAANGFRYNPSRWRVR